jgi:hypothetical protein
VDLPDMESITQSHKNEFKQHMDEAEEVHFGARNLCPCHGHFMHRYSQSLTQIDQLHIKAPPVYKTTSQLPLSSQSIDFSSIPHISLNISYSLLLLISNLTKDIHDPTMQKSVNPST